MIHREALEGKTKFLKVLEVERREDGVQVIGLEAVE